MVAVATEGYKGLVTVNFYMLERGVSELVQESALVVVLENDSRYVLHMTENGEKNCMEMSGDKK